MNILDSMKEKLEPLGIYNLEDDSLVCKELQTYAESLKLVKDSIDELEKEYFINTAESYGLTLREKMYTSAKSDLDVEKRRDMLKYRYSITSNDFNKEDIKKALLAIGIKCEVIEYPNENTIYINCLENLDTTISKDDLKILANEFLPAHLSYEIDFRLLKWSEIESRNLSFQDMDDKDMTWSQIDTFQNS